MKFCIKFNFDTLIFIQNSIQKLPQKQHCNLKYSNICKNIKDNLQDISIKEKRNINKF